MYPWQVETNVHLPGGATSVAHQFLRCILHQLAPNGVFIQMFQTQATGMTNKRFSNTEGMFTKIYLIFRNCKNAIFPKCIASTIRFQRTQPNRSTTVSFRSKQKYGIDRIHFTFLKIMFNNFVLL